MFDLGEPWYAIAVRTAIVYTALLVGIRLTGKRQIGQMAPFDLVLILLIANAVQNAMVGTDTSVTGGLVAGAVLLVVNLIVSRLNQLFPFFRRLAEGEPAVLLSHGEVIPGALRKQGIDQADLEQAVRERGIATLAEVEFAVLEVDGTISIVPREGGVVRSRRRVRQMKHG